MAVPSILLPQTQRELIRQVADVRSLAYGGYFGHVVPDQDRNHNDLFEFDATVTSSANIVARGATNVDATRQTNNVVNQRAVQVVRSEAYTQDEAEFMATIGVNADSPAIRARLVSMARGMQQRNMEGIEIVRGYLASCMAVGEIAWSHLGFIADAITFRMPSAMRYVPGTYWRSGVAGSTYNAAATPLSDIFGLDYQASIFGDVPFNMIGMSYQAYLAMTATDEYKNRAVARNVVIYANGLPNPNSPQGKELAEAVLGKQIVWLDQTFQREIRDGSRETVRYTPEDYTVLWRKEDEGSKAKWEMGVVPLTKSIIAEMGPGSNPFGGIARGPLGWSSVDDKEFTNARLLAAWEGFPLRRTNAVTAVIANRART